MEIAVTREDRGAALYLGRLRGELLDAVHMESRTHASGMLREAFLAGWHAAMCARDSDDAERPCESCGSGLDEAGTACPSCGPPCQGALSG